MKGRSGRLAAGGPRHGWGNQRLHARSACLSPPRVFIPGRAMCPGSAYFNRPSGRCRPNSAILGRALLRRRGDPWTAESPPIVPSRRHPSPFIHSVVGRGEVESGSFPPPPPPLTPPQHTWWADSYDTPIFFKEFAFFSPPPPPHLPFSPPRSLLRSEMPTQVQPWAGMRGVHQLGGGAVGRPSRELLGTVPSILLRGLPSFVAC